MKFEKLLDSAIQNTELKTENLDKILSWEIDFFSEDKTYEYKKPVFTWWFETTDSTFWMFDTKKFITIVWESGAWKTEYAVFMGNKNASIGNKTIMISLEMGTIEIYERMAYKRLWISKTKINNWLSEFEQNKVTQSINELKRWPIEIKWLNVIANMDNIEKLLNKLKNEWYKLVIIDSMDKIIGKDKQSDAERLAEISNKMKTLAINLDISIAMIHHFTKWNDKDRSSQRWIASMRWSGKIENDSDYVLQVYRNKIQDKELTLEEDKQKVVLTLMKDRTYWDNYIYHNIYFRNWKYYDFLWQ